MHPRGPNLVHTDLVSYSDGTSHQRAIYSASRSETTISTRDNQETSVKQQTHTHGLSVIRETLQNKNISERATNVIMCSWRHGTQKQYSMYIKKWFDYCREREINSVQASLSDILDYLASLVESGLSHSAINSARSALSAVGLVRDGFSVGSHPLVIRLVKGAYNMKPPQSRYSETWDVSLVLTYLKTLTPDDELSLKVLTLKLVMLIALVLASRCHSLHLLSIENMRKEPSKYVLRYSGPLKQSRPGIKIPCAELKVFPPDRRISVFHVLEVYLQKTEAIRGNVNSLFISYIKPYKAVSSATIGRWIRSVMSSSGIDCEKYKAHSVRSASASKAKFCQIPIQDIMKTAGWSSSRTFSQFYDKKVDNTDYSSTILNNQST